MTIDKRAWIYDLLLIIVLMVGTYFRVLGLNWDADQHLHPDERFLTMVESALDVKKCSVADIPVSACPPDQVHWLDFGDYLDTASSPLNPHNRGYGFFVYGDFPIVLVRYIAEWLGQVGYDQVHLVGRQVSALSDLLTILLLYIIGSRLYNRRVALLGAAFTSLAVLQIQQSHFFTVDVVANLFIFLALLFAVQIVLHQTRAERQALDEGAVARDEHPLADGGLHTLPPDSHITSFAPRVSGSALDILRFLVDPLLLLSLGFGLALGLAVASKLNAAPLAIMLPGAFFVRYLIKNSNLRLDGAASQELLHR